MNSSRRKVFFRVDAGSQRGLSFGHLFRCLEIANELSSSHDIQSVFVMQNIPEGVRTAKENGASVVTLPTDITREEEISQMRAAPGDTAIFDLIDAETYDFSRLHKAGVKTMSLDDFGSKTIASQILVNGSIYSQSQNYGVPKSVCQKQFMGSDYCVIGKKFGAARRDSVSKSLIRILATFGGSDPADLSKKTAEALLGLPDTYEITILVGPGYQPKNTLVELIQRQNRPSFLVKQNVPDILPEILWADLVITAGGRTVYEIAATGTPMILIPSIDHEQPVSAAIAEHGAGYDLGPWGSATRDKLLEKVKILGPEKVREKMRKNGLSIVDGNGLARVCNLIARQYDPVREKA